MMVVDAPPVTQEEFDRLQKQVIELERRLAIFMRQHRQASLIELAASEDFQEMPRTVQSRWKTQ